MSWYTKGGFTDENGKRHESGNHYTFPYWEVLNEIDFEHNTTPEDYTKRYDAIVEGIRQGQSRRRGSWVLRSAAPGANPKYFEYFLNPKNHRQGIPLDYISFHFYATPAMDENAGRLAAYILQPGGGLLSPPRDTSSRFAIGSRRRPRSTRTSWA